jgi:hypothetical protein
MTDELTTPSEGDSTSPASTEEEIKWPISFMLILALTAIYVGWRIIQMLGNLFG